MLGGRDERLATLKQDVVRSGVKAVTGIDMPVNPKRRFQDGAAASPRARVTKTWCRNAFARLWQSRLREANDNLETRRSGNETAVRA
jgi:asparagine synthase (glutamine-hydrolysing)